MKLGTILGSSQGALYAAAYNQQQDRKKAEKRQRKKDAKAARIKQLKRDGWKWRKDEEL